MATRVYYNLINCIDKNFICRSSENIINAEVNSNNLKNNFSTSTFDTESITSDISTATLVLDDDMTESDTNNLLQRPDSQISTISEVESRSLINVLGLEKYKNLMKNLQDSESVLDCSDDADTEILVNQSKAIWNSRPSTDNDVQLSTHRPTFDCTDDSHLEIEPNTTISYAFDANDIYKRAENIHNNHIIEDISSQDSDVSAFVYPVMHFREQEHVTKNSNDVVNEATKQQSYNENNSVSSQMSVSPSLTVSDKDEQLHSKVNIPSYPNDDFDNESISSTNSHSPLVICTECQTMNKSYLTWCIDCGATLKIEAPDETVEFSIPLNMNQLSVDVSSIIAEDSHCSSVQSSQSAVNSVSPNIDIMKVVHKSDLDDNSSFINEAKSDEHSGDDFIGDNARIVEEDIVDLRESDDFLYDDKETKPLSSLSKALREELSLDVCSSIETIQDKRSGEHSDSEDSDDTVLFSYRKDIASPQKPSEFKLNLSDLETEEKPEERDIDEHKSSQLSP